MEQLKLNMIPNGVNPVFHASQYDKGRQIRFVLDETLSSAEVTTSYRAKDGTEHGNVQTSVSGNTITDTIPEEVLTDYGIIEGEVNIDGIGSLNFFIEVEKDAYDGGDIITQTATGAIATFETNIETAFVSLKSDINPVQSGTGTPSPDNVRPISGFSALNVTRTGKNLVDFLSHLRASASGLTISATSDGAIHYQGTATAAYSQLTSTFNQSIKSGTTITFSRDRVLNHQQYLDLTFTDNTHDYLRIQANETSKTYTFAKDLKSIEMVCLGLSVGTTYDETVKFMVELGSTATDFEPYNGQTATVNFGQTVYGGVADVTGGSVVSEWGYFTIPTIANYNTSGGHNYTYNTPTGMIVEGGTHFDLIAEALASNGTLGDKFTMYRINNGVVIGVPDNFTVADYNSQIAGTHLLYPLATPTEITTTPENLTALSGQNNVYGDTNGDTTVEYYIEV